MARPAGGEEVLARAKEVLAKAQTAEELRQAQAVILPLEFGFSMDQVAAIIGVSKGWACQLRARFIRSGGVRAEEKKQRGGRRRENLSKESEAAFLAPFLDKAARGEILVIGEIKKSLEKQIGRKVALASVYNLLHRQNCRKLVSGGRQSRIDAEHGCDGENLSALPDGA